MVTNINKKLQVITKHHKKRKYVFTYFTFRDIIHSVIDKKITSSEIFYESE